MSETTPEPETTDLGAIPGTPDEGERAPLGPITVTEVKPQDVGTFSLRYVGNVPQLVVTGGTTVPSAITVVDASGTTLATYSADDITPATPTPAARTGRALPIDQNQLVGCAGPNCKPISLRP